MKRKYLAHWMLFVMIFFFVACGPAVLPPTSTPTATTIVEDSLFMTAQMGSTLAGMLTQTAASCASCSDQSASLTAAMATAFASTPSNTPPAGVTYIPSAGDLGWGSVYGVIRDAFTFLPIKDATIRCLHSSYAAEYRCQGVTTTNGDGLYSFTPVFFHDTDRITLIVEAAGYEPLYFEESFFSHAEMYADLALFPPATPTPTSQISCTPPACSNGVLTCGDPNGCPGGCGTICQIASPTFIISCTPPICTNGVLTCGDINGCPGGCGTVCQRPSPTP
jgi:hypothetical protein